MRAINHALTGALIGLAVGEPLIAVPAALASHFVCDAIPHYDDPTPTKEAWIASRKFLRLLVADAVLCLGLVIVLAAARPRHWLLACLCAFLAAAPDLLSLNHYIKTKFNKKWQPGLFSKFADNIQWFARPIGAVVEVAWFVAALVLLEPFLR